MPINSKHPTYEGMLKKYRITENAIKGDVQQYVPRLEGQSYLKHDQYVDRAAYYNVTERTMQALLGALLRKPYRLTGLPAEPLTDCDSFGEFIQGCYLDVLESGRLGILVDYDEASQSPKLVSYCAEHIINWSDDFVVIEEHFLEPNGKDPYVLESKTRWRELRLDEAGLYEIRLWEEQGTNRKKFNIVETYQPTIRGQRLSAIPFFWVNSMGNSTYPAAPPLYTLSTLNINHFKTSVDYAHGLHFLALPTPYIAGDVFTTDGNQPTSLSIGTENFIHLVQGSTVGFLEFSGQGIGAIHTQLKSLEEQMFQAGSRLLTHKSGVESAEALRLRAGSETATLTTMANALEHALQAALAIYGQWTATASEASISLNKDFTDSRIEPSELKSLLEAYSAGVISLDSLLIKLFEGEVIADPVAEKKALEASEPEVPVTTSQDPESSF